MAITLAVWRKLVGVTTKKCLSSTEETDQVLVVLSVGP